MKTYEHESLCCTRDPEEFTKMDTYDVYTSEVTRFGFLLNKGQAGSNPQLATTGRCAFPDPIGALYAIEEEIRGKPSRPEAEYPSGPSQTVARRTSRLDGEGTGQTIVEE
jgi:hypothetical protein